MLPASGADGQTHDRGRADDAPPPLKTVVRITHARTIIARNDSPDIPFSQSINPYQGCEHGCIYCYARPTHAYLDLSPGLDFETKLFAKPNAAALLKDELAITGLSLRADRARRQHRPLPADRTEWKITRSVIEVLSECDHPLTITTKARSSNAISISWRRWPPRASSACSSRSRCSTASSRGSSIRARRRRTAASRSSRH
jgi:hypothetical protein